MSTYQGSQLFQVWWSGKPWQAGQVRAFGPAPLLQGCIFFQVRAFGPAPLLQVPARATHMQDPVQKVQCKIPCKNPEKATCKAGQAACAQVQDCAKTQKRGMGLNHA
jgi:hypothetical protein